MIIFKENHKKNKNNNFKIKSSIGQNSEAQILFTSGSTGKPKVLF